MTSDATTLVVFCTYAAALTAAITLPLGYAIGRADWRSARRAESAAVAGYARVPAPEPVHVDPDDAGHDRFGSAEQVVPDNDAGWLTRTRAVVDERWTSFGPDRHDGWATPDGLAELKAISGGRHAAPDEVTP